MDNFFEMSNISKTFSGVEVLHNVSLELTKGEIRALLGANGAGKSTLINIMSGNYPPTEGVMKLNGEEITVKDPLAAQKLGISVIHQELNLIPSLTVMQNIFLGREIRKNGLLDEKAMREVYSKFNEELAFDLPPDVIVKKLSIAQQQMVEIMKAMSFDSQIIVMDEPTTALTDNEKPQLFEIIRQLKARGKTIIYISHIIEEIFTLADNVSFLRNGKMIGTFSIKDLTLAKICEYMSGTSYEGIHREKSHRRENAAPVLEVKNMCRGNRVKDVSFTVQPGEVVGLAGLVGSGRSEITRVIFGADRIQSGQIFVDGEQVDLNSPHDAIKKGIGYISENRKEEGLILAHPIYQNATLTQLKNMLNHGMLCGEKERKYMANAIERLSIKLNNIENPVSSLSGGNQQKVAISKWLMDDLRVLILDEPTKGIDVNAKEDVFHIISQFASTGMGIIFISSDLDEVIRCSDKILVIYDGGVVSVQENNNITQRDIMNIILKQHFVDPEEVQI